MQALFEAFERFDILFVKIHFVISVLRNSDMHLDLSVHSLFCSSLQIVARLDTNMLNISIHMLRDILLCVYLCKNIKFLQLCFARNCLYHVCIRNKMLFFSKVIFAKHHCFIPYPQVSQDDVSNFGDVIH